MLLLLLAVSNSAFAQDGGVVVANISREPESQQNNNILPPLVTEKYDYYTVGGCREKDLQCDLKQKCLTWKDGKKYDSITHWKMKWDYGRERTPQACAADSFRVTVDVIYYLPKWARLGDAPQQLVDKWDDYMNSLLTHETGHRDLAIEAAADLTRAVAELPPAATCAELDRQVQALGRERMNRLKVDEKEYDVATNHGKSQGAVFP
jgi:predicted secreted Zn-dependent protease